MPPNEVLVAASLRVYYSPRYRQRRLTQGESRSVSCQIRGQHQWPMLVWLDTDPDTPYVKKHSLAYLTGLASFEPAADNCLLFQQRHPNNGQSPRADNSTPSLLMLPEGWFNLALNESVLKYLVEHGHRPYSNRGIWLRIYSAVAFDGAKRRSLHMGDSLSGSGGFNLDDDDEQDRLNDDHDDRKLSSDERETMEWTERAPHLITFHRDDRLADKLKRSPPRPYVASLHKSETDNQRLFRVRRSELNPGLLAPHKHQPQQPDSPNEDPKIRHRRQSGYKTNHARRHYSYNQQGNAVRGSSPTAAASSTATHVMSKTQTGPAKSPVRSYSSAYHYGRYRVRPLSHRFYLDTTCKRRELIIDFKAIGWDGFIKSPRKADIGHCYGRCPFPLSAHYNATNHAVILQLANMYGLIHFDGPCCVPYNLTSQSVLKSDKMGDEAIQFLPDSVVETCACK